jgi:ABC-type antimicrobial peptide transport system permease subunit
MEMLFAGIRYAIRQFRVARIFTVTAILTLALGIGGTTAIFTLIHAVMLRSLPVGDPSRLYRVGDGTSCCVQGGPQDRWGMFSYPLFERLKADRVPWRASGLFGIVALVLAAIGLHGVTAYTVAQRTNEIRLRMALGADRQRVVSMVLQGAFRRIAIGLALGLPLAVGAGRLLAAQLYGVQFWDPLALAVAAASLSACAFLAAIIPAARAASISPMSALRTE